MMPTPRAIQFAIPLLLAIGVAGCNRGKQSTPSAEPSVAPAATPALATLQEYEKIHDLLARDQTSGLADRASALEQQARTAAGGASVDSKQKLAAIAQAAGALRNKASEIEPARHAFGELSRAVISLLSADPKLREGRYVFECPMAEGYRKWVQTTAEIKNPYMGSKMPDCGVKSDWAA
jgi:hypothetical protein